jgi:very-short-patch-repair endonuclease
MPTTTEIISTHQSKINQRIEAYISEFLDLCESEIERLFLSSLFYHYFDNEFMFGLPLKGDTFDDETYTFSFSKLTPVFISSVDKDFDKVNRKILFEDAYQYKLIGFEFRDGNTKFTFLPQHEIEIGGKKYRLDFALYYSVIKDGKTKVKVKVVIECDGFEHHHTKEQQINDSIRSRQLTLNDWKIYRMTGTEINQNSDISAITNIIKDLRYLCNKKGAEFD